MAFGIDDAAIATILAGLVSTAGSLYANRKNIDAQKEANSINWEIARQNNATQIEMANTAHQREVRDLRRAGLNPILSAGGNGSSTPSISAATISPTHTDNAFEGLANSAKGVGRYFGQQYQAQLEAQQLANAAQKQDNDISRLEAHSSLPSLDAQYLQGQLDKMAFMQETGIGLNRKSDGTVEPYVDDIDKANKALDLARQGVRSDLKLRSNANWRANLSSFTPFVSPAAVNSAGAAAQRIRYLWRTR